MIVLKLLCTLLHLCLLQHLTYTLPCQNILVPAYFDPSSDSSDWTAMYGNSGIIIMNPDSGPGKSKESAYSSAVNKAVSNGNQIIGYVHTSYGSRNISTVESEITDYYQWYGSNGISGIFLDEVSSSKDEISYYTQIYNFIKNNYSNQDKKDIKIKNQTVSMNSNDEYINITTKHDAIASSNYNYDNIVVINPGTVPNIGYLNVSDIIVAFESSVNDYNDWDPDWTDNVESKHIGHIVYDVSDTQEMNQTIAKSRERNAMYIFVCDSNSYQTLPDYWNKETSYIDSEC